MYSLPLLVCTLFSGLATAVENAGLAGIGISPAQPTIDSRIVPRDLDNNCFTSVMSQLSLPTPTNTDLHSWATDSLELPACTATAPASLSSDFMSYDSVISTWLSTLGSVADGIHTKCGAHTFSLAFSAYCSTSRTIYFTDAEKSQTATETATLPNYAQPTTIYVDSAAARKGLPLVVAIIAGLMISL